MEYHDSETATEVADRVESFMDEVVIPREREALRTSEDITRDEIEELWEMAKERDLFAPQMPEKYGGQGLDFQNMLPSFEQVGRSLIGALSIRANAPHEGTCTPWRWSGPRNRKRNGFDRWYRGDLVGVFDDRTHARRGSDPKMLRRPRKKTATSG